MQGHNQQSGFILATTLIMLVIIMLATVATMELSRLDYKISSNAAFKDMAFQSSETGRTSAGEAVSHYLYERSWTGLSVTGLTYDAAYDPASDALALSENLYDTSTLVVDMAYATTSGASIEESNANISIAKAQGVTSSGAGLQQLAGYEGAGKSAGNGGIFLIYEFRSTGTSAAEASAVTASEYRVVP